LGTSESEIPGILEELSTVANVAGYGPKCDASGPDCPMRCPHDVSLCSRRIAYDETKREQERNKKRHQRQTAPVPKMSPPLSRKSPAVDVHKVIGSDVINTKKTPTPSAPKSGAANPAVGRLNKLFYELLELKIGSSPRFNFPQAGQEFKRLLRGNSEIIIATTIKNFFESTDTFIANKAYSWGAFVTNFNVLRSTGGPIHAKANTTGANGKDNRYAGQFLADPESAKQYNAKVER
jgi:hypothetical protein